MTRLWNRSSSLYVYTSETNETKEIDMSLLDFEFEVSGSLPTKKDGKVHTRPTTARVSIYKLNADSRDTLSANGKGLELWSGYDGDESMLFRGVIVNIPAPIKQNGLDWVSTVHAKDAWENFDTATFNRSYPTDTDVVTIINDIADSFGVPVTNEFDRTESLLTGSSFFGRSRKLMDSLAQDYDFSWSINTEKGVRIEDRLNPPLIDHTQVIVLTRDVLLSPPAVEESIENEGKKDEQLVRRINTQCILNPNIKQGSVIQFDTESMSRDFADIATKELAHVNPKAYYVVQEYAHRGSTMTGGDHSTEITTKEETV